jgi:acyl-CoA thioesterase
MSSLRAPWVDDDAYRAAEREFLGLEMDEGARTGVVTAGDLLHTNRGTLYGGGMLAVAIAAMETNTRRRSVWATAQFVGSAPTGARLVLEVDELARGARASQVLVRGTHRGETVVAALGATGDERPDGFAAEYATMPTVPEPSECTPLFPRRADAAPGYQSFVDVLAAGVQRETRPPALLAWARTRDHCTSLPAMLAMVADQLPFTVAHLAGAPGAGSSLDNTMRVGPPAACEWVLLELRPDLGARGYGHGSVWVWSPDGQLLAVGSQTSGMQPAMPFAADTSGSG